MNIISYNVRGLGRGVKWTTIRRLVKKHQADMLCIPETKREQIDKTMCQALWGNTELSQEIQPATNTAGGLLCIWNEQVFKVEKRVIGTGFILLEGVLTQEMQKICIINIYAPCDVNKRALQESIRQIKNLDPSGLWCILGDFNSIKHPSERVSATQREVDVNNINEFNEWIAATEVEDLPCVGRKFT